MIRFSFLFSMLFLCCSTFAQKDISDLISRLEKQAVEIDSLKKIIKMEIETKHLLQNENKYFKDTLNFFKLEFANIEQYKSSKSIFDSLLREKIDSLSLLKLSLSSKENELVLEKIRRDKEARERYENGKNAILNSIVNRYKGQSFDFLIKSSTLQSISQDLQLCQGIPEITLILTDIQKIIFAKELFYNKVDAYQLKNIQSEIGQINRESLELRKLKEIISSYKSVNDGLKELIERIIELDKREEVARMDNETQRKKFNKILAEFTSYIFNYDFNFSDYPYLSDIFLQIIKRKQPNPDAVISDLLRKL